MDVYHNPSKYTDIIGNLMERYDSEHKREGNDESWDDDNGI